MLSRLLLLVVLALSPAAALAQSGPVTADDVTLQPGDIVRVAIWREEGLSGDFPVSRSGTVTLPLIGEKSVSGIPLHQLRDVLIEDYRVHLRNPAINITPLRRINILGEVQRPGRYEVDPTVSLVGAVGLAGGATPSGDLNRIRIVREGEVIRQGLSAHSGIDLMEIRSGDQIFVERRGWFDRNSTFVVSAVLSVTSIIITLVR